MKEMVNDHTIKREREKNKKMRKKDPKTSNSSKRKIYKV